MFFKEVITCWIELHFIFELHIMTFKLNTLVAIHNGHQKYKKLILRARKSSFSSLISHIFPLSLMLWIEIVSHLKAL